MNPEGTQDYCERMGWYAVRHVIKNEDAYEERTTVW
jgi:hypothetical protein